MVNSLDLQKLKKKKKKKIVERIMCSISHSSKSEENGYRGDLICVSLDSFLFIIIIIVHLLLYFRTKCYEFELMK